MADIQRPEQIANEFGFNDFQKFRRRFSDLISVVSGQELMDKELVEGRLNDLVNPNSISSIDQRKKHSHKSTGDNLGQINSRIKRLQKSIKKLVPDVEQAKAKHEKTSDQEDRLQYLQLNEDLMSKEKSLLNAKQEYDRIIKERIQKITGDQK